LPFINSNHGPISQRMPDKRRFRSEDVNYSYLFCHPIWVLQSEFYVVILALNIRMMA